MTGYFNSLCRAYKSVETTAFALPCGIGHRLQQAKAAVKTIPTALSQIAQAGAVHAKETFLRKGIRFATGYSIMQGEATRVIFGIVGSAFGATSGMVTRNKFDFLLTSGVALAAIGVAEGYLGKGISVENFQGTLAYSAAYAATAIKNNGGRESDDSFANIGLGLLGGALPTKSSIPTVLGLQGAFEIGSYISARRQTSLPIYFTSKIDTFRLIETGVCAAATVAGYSLAGPVGSVALSALAEFTVRGFEKSRNRIIEKFNASMNEIRNEGRDLILTNYKIGKFDGRDVGAIISGYDSE